MIAALFLTPLQQRIRSLYCFSSPLPCNVLAKLMKYVLKIDRLSKGVNTSFHSFDDKFQPHQLTKLAFFWHFFIIKLTQYAYLCMNVSTQVTDPMPVLHCQSKGHFHFSTKLGAKRASRVSEVFLFLTLFTETFCLQLNPVFWIVHLYLLDNRAFLPHLLHITKNMFSSTHQSH